MPQVDNVLRPKKLNSFFGQDRIVSKLKVYIFSAKSRKTVLDHALFYGPPGLGKTTLASIIANEMNSKLITITANSLDKVGDLVSILGQINPGDILFIDEIHRLKKELMETLYSAMEDFKVYVPYKNEENTKMITLNLSPFTLIGATTNAGNIVIPLRDRFSIIEKFEYYKINDLIKIIKELETKFNLKFEESCYIEIAQRSRETPRYLISILKRLYDYKIYKKIEVFNEKELNKAFKFLQIYKYGLNEEDLLIIKLMKEKFYYPVSLEVIASLLNEDVNNIRNINEPFLVKEGIIERTKKGRILTKRGIEIYKEIKGENIT